MTDPIAMARALEAKAADRREENRRKFPTAAKLMESFKMFAPVVVEASESGNYVVCKGWVQGKSVIPYIGNARHSERMVGWVKR